MHNLEHGYTVVWYDSTIKGDDLQALKDLAASARTSDAGRAGRSSSCRRGTTPTASSRPASTSACRTGARRTATSSSAARSAAPALDKFMTKYPSTDAPEPNAA